ncbi:MAG: hypothetical protein K8W52_20545 [Deltaproteobacteria bacterium]|nr:hypothetical protein [Deltaproteobacteria bacterium]
MTTSTMAARAFAAAGLALASTSLVACSDSIQCTTGALVLIERPTGTIATDADPATPGIQTDVVVRSTLAQGEAMSLAVVDGTGATLSTTMATAVAGGSVTFTGVTVPLGAITLRASAVGTCGADDDETAIDVIAGADCQVGITPTPLDNAYYAPLRVLTAALDADHVAAGFQGTVDVAAAAGWGVELFATGADGAEASVGTATATAGVASFAVSLPDGRISVRAVCRDPLSTATSASPTTTVQIDTSAPSCEIATPAPGSTITPAYDADGDLGNGVQLDVVGSYSGGDLAGGAATLTVIAPDGSRTDLPVTISSDSSTTAVTFAPATTPATYGLELAASDHAGNPCTPPHEDYRVVYDGCDIAVTAPPAPVTVDADASAANGAQLDAALTIATACAGRTVTTDCGAQPSTAIVPADGLLTMRLTACATEPCELSEACTFRVSTADGIETSAGLDLVYDDAPPAVTVAIVDPIVACVAVIGADADVDGAQNGVQIIARVTAPGASTRQLKLVTGAGTSTVDATGDTTVTLGAGANTLTGIATDALGNQATTAGCAITLADLAVSFAAPAADGLLASTDGTVAGVNLTTNICGAVNKTGATVTLKVDGGAAQPATVTGTTWCRQVTLATSPPSHTLVAQAQAGASFGQATLVVAVDLTAPGAITDLVGVARNRREIATTWTAPADAGAAVDHYVLRRATTALTNGNFDSTGTIIATAAPKSPGASEALVLDHLQAGTSYWIGIAAVDAAGNRSVADIVGPLTPAFDQSGAITPPDGTANLIGLGWSIAHGRFNDDAYADVAVGAASRWSGMNGVNRNAGAVYVYFGGPTGLPTTPSAIIESTEANAQLGFDVTAVRWSSATRDDLVIGAPNSQASRGRIFVFRGGASFPTGTVNVSTASQVIGVNSTTPGWFAGGSLGYQLATADVDGDGTDDLVASAINGGGTKGGVVVIFGGTASAAAIALSDTDPSGLAGVEAQILENPAGVTGRSFGRYLFAVGRTTGAGDLGDDLLIGQTDDTTTAGDSVWLYRGAAPRTPGVSFRSFAAGTDVRIDYVTTDLTTAFGAQATSVPDQNGDGARDLAIGGWQVGNNDGQVILVDGDTVGTAGVAKTSDAGIVLGSISGTASARFGIGIATADGTSGDIDGDGANDLMVAALFGGAARMYAWSGTALPAGSATTSSASYVLTGPTTFSFSWINPAPPAVVAWVGDVNGDGLDDACWSSPLDNTRDGSFELLWDDGL